MSGRKKKAHQRNAQGSRQTFSSLEEYGTLGYLPSSTPTSTEGVDPTIIVLLSKLKKRDQTTRIKSLTELLKRMETLSEEEIGNVVVHWPRLYARLTPDSNRRIRELTQRVWKMLSLNGKKKIMPVLQSVMGAWLCAMFDTNESVSSIATSAFEETFTEERRIPSIVFCQADILKYINRNICETNFQTLQEAATGENEMELREKLTRLHETSVRALEYLLKTVELKHLKKVEGDYTSLLTSPKLWKLCKTDIVSLHRAVCSLAREVLLHHAVWVEDIQTRIVKACTAGLSSKLSGIEASSLAAAVLFASMPNQLLWGVVSFDSIATPFAILLASGGGVQYTTTYTALSHLIKSAPEGTSLSPVFQALCDGLRTFGEKDGGKVDVWATAFLDSCKAIAEKMPEAFLEGDFVSTCIKMLELCICDRSCCFGARNNFATIEASLFNGVNRSIEEIKRCMLQPLCDSIAAKCMAKPSQQQLQQQQRISAAQTSLMEMGGKDSVIASVVATALVLRFVEERATDKKSKSLNNDDLESIASFLIDFDMVATLEAPILKTCLEIFLDALELNSTCNENENSPSAASSLSTSQALFVQVCLTISSALDTISSALVAFLRTCTEPQENILRVVHAVKSAHVNNALFCKIVDLDMLTCLSATCSELYATHQWIEAHNLLSELFSPLSENSHLCSNADISTAFVYDEDIKHNMFQTFCVQAEAEIGWRWEELAEEGANEDDKKKRDAVFFCVDSMLPVIIKTLSGMHVSDGDQDARKKLMVNASKLASHVIMTPSTPINMRSRLIDIILAADPDYLHSKHDEIESEFDGCTSITTMTLRMCVQHFIFQLKECISSEFARGHHTISGNGGDDDDGTKAKRRRLLRQMDTPLMLKVQWLVESLEAINCFTTFQEHIASLLPSMVTSLFEHNCSVTAMEEVTQGVYSVVGGVTTINSIVNNEDGNENSNLSILSWINDEERGAWLDSDNDETGEDEDEEEDYDDEEVEKEEEEDSVRLKRSIIAGNSSTKGASKHQTQTQTQTQLAFPWHQSFAANEKFVLLKEIQCRIACHLLQNLSFQHLQDSYETRKGTDLFLSYKRTLLTNLMVGMLLKHPLNCDSFASMFGELMGYGSQNWSPASVGGLVQNIVTTYMEEGRVSLLACLSLLIPSLAYAEEEKEKKSEKYHETLDYLNNLLLEDIESFGGEPLSSVDSGGASNQMMLSRKTYLVCVVLKAISTSLSEKQITSMQVKALRVQSFTLSRADDNDDNDDITSKKNMFDNIVKAYKCLSDPKLRALYDAESAQQNEKQELPFHDEVVLEDLDFDKDDGCYFFECRCGGEYILERDTVLDQNNPSGPPWIVPCNTCTFAIKINK
eukprot:m.99841 g.99841  ORF g.99841 m.99841 type:complete len:1360 (-) comp9034_c2_seq1:5045-9124(-)